ncbi:MAG TPA: threonylcarbamoyl-AMP synthase [Elusimicrobia bacterium]|nr:threonylcarbamoyl-AMP synthase [Elusimicrobiota bacterium]HBT62297.1 threonylcarbamoyl-AMP synthase [Elusimicrobiota bacterium]
MPEAAIISLAPGGALGPDALARVTEAVRRGEVVAFPTDTVYGLGCSALSRQGLERIYRIKGRSPDKPLPLLIASCEDARHWAQWTPQAEALARRFWPGALTLVLRASSRAQTLPAPFFGQEEPPTLALRVPAHAAVRALLAASGVPWAATSANRAGESPLPDGAAAALKFKDALAFVIDAGPCHGRESTVVDASASPVRVLREGRIPAGEISAVFAASPQRVLFVCTGNTCRSVMAEFLFNSLARGRGLDCRARSGGVAAERYFQVPTGVHAALRDEGVSITNHVPQLISRELLSWADLVLTMERHHHDAILNLYPEFRGKVQVLKNFARRPGLEDIPDPIGKPDAVYAACCREIKESLEVILNRHVQQSQEARP